MRISSSLMATIGLNSMLAQQKRLSETQIQLATGKRISAPSDDPYGSARSLALSISISSNEQYQKNSIQIENRLGFEEGTLEGIGNALQRVRELTISANNDSQTSESRKFIRSEIKELLKQIIALSNTQDSNGEFIFSGYQGRTKPFDSDGNGNFTYSGDDGQRFLKIGSTTSVAMGDSGEATFLRIKNGNGTYRTQDDPNNTGGGIIDPGTVSGKYVADNYRIEFIPPSNGGIYDSVEYYVLDGNNQIIAPATEAGDTEADFLAKIAASTAAGVAYEDGAIIQGLDSIGVNTSISGEPLNGDSYTIKPSTNQSVFSTIQNLIDTLGSPQQGVANLTEFHNSMNRNIVDLDQSIGSILQVRTSIGARLNTIDKQLAVTETFNLQLRTTLSEIQDLDYAEAVTRLNLQLVGLQAAQNAYTRVQGLSLFDYL